MELKEEKKSQLKTQIKIEEKKIEKKIEQQSLIIEGQIKNYLEKTTKKPGETQKERFTRMGDKYHSIDASSIKYDNQKDKDISSQSLLDKTIELSKTRRGFKREEGSSNLAGQFTIHHSQSTHPTTRNYSTNINKDSYQNTSIKMYSERDRKRQSNDAN